MVGTGPGEDEPEVTDRVLPLRVWRSVLLFSSVMKTQAGKHGRASNLGYRTGQTEYINNPFCQLKEIRHVVQLFTFQDVWARFQT